MPHHEDEALNYAHACGVLDAFESRPFDAASHGLTAPALMEAYGHGWYQEMYLTVLGEMTERGRHGSPQ